MFDLPDTRQSLILRLRDAADQSAWTEFVETYEPAVYRLARGRGLQHADALDLVQDVLSAVAGMIDRFDADPERGCFRGWLRRIARNLTVNALTRGGRIRGSGDSQMVALLQNLPDETGPEVTRFEIEYRREVFSRAARAVRAEVHETTWQCFWLTAIDGADPTEVSRQFSLSVGTVYAARSRVLARLKRVVQELEGTP